MNLQDAVSENEVLENAGAVLGLVEDRRELVAPYGDVDIASRLLSSDAEVWTLHQQLVSFFTKDVTD